MHIENQIEEKTRKVREYNAKEIRIYENAKFFQKYFEQEEPRGWQQQQDERRQLIKELWREGDDSDSRE